MKVQGALLQGGLAVFALGAAYTSWQKEPEKAAGDVVVVDAGRGDVSLVRFDEESAKEKSFVELRREGDAVWIKLSARPDAKQPEREVRGSEAAERLLDSFAPLRATRALGVFDEVKLRELGLAPPATPDGGTPPPWKKRHVEVTARGDKRGFLAGTPPGFYTSYFRDDRDGRVYVVSGSVLSDLESASSRMVDRQLHAFKTTDFDAVTVEAGGKKRELVVMPSENSVTVKLASKKTPDKADDTAKNWHDRIFRLYAMEVLGKGEKPAAGEPQVLFKVSYLSKGQDKGFVEIGKLSVTPPPPPAKPNQSPPPPPAPITEYYARSEHTAGWIKLGGGIDEIAKEAEKIAAAE